MFSYPIIPDNSEAQHSSISIYIPSAGRSFMLEFLIWSFKNHLIRCFPNCLWIFWSSAVRISYSRRDLRLFADPEGRPVDFRWSWITIRFAGCFGIMMDFFKQPQASVQIKATESIWTFYRSFDWCDRYCLLLCLRIILTWNPIDYHISHLLLVVHQRIYCLGISSLCL